MMQKLTVALATALAMAAMPQVAQASCSGNGCPQMTFDGANFTNHDKFYTMQIKGCFIQKNGTTCGSPPMTFLVILDPGQSKPAGVPPSLGYPANVNANAVFMGELRPHVPAVPNAK